MFRAKKTTSSLQDPSDFSSFLFSRTNYALFCPLASAECTENICSPQCFCFWQKEMLKWFLLAPPPLSPPKSSSQSCKYMKVRDHTWAWSRLHSFILRSSIKLTFSLLIRRHSHPPYLNMPYTRRVVVLSMKFTGDSCKPEMCPVSGGWAISQIIEEKYYSCHFFFFTQTSFFMAARGKK